MIKFSGTRADYGKFYADIMRANGHDFYRHVNPETLHRQTKIYHKFYPEIITELEAVAEAIGLPPEFILYEDIAAPVDHWRDRIHQRNHGCTIFAIHENGQTFVGRNYDWLPAAREFYEGYKLEIKGANPYFAFSDGSVWRHQGSNLQFHPAQHTLWRISGDRVLYCFYWSAKRRYLCQQRIDFSGAR